MLFLSEDADVLLNLVADEVSELERCLRCLQLNERDPSTLALARAVLKKPAPARDAIVVSLRCLYREWRVVSDEAPGDRRATLKEEGKWGRCRPRVGDFVETNWNADDEIAAVGKVQSVRDDRCLLDHIGVVGRDSVRAELSTVRLCSPETILADRRRIIQAFQAAISVYQLPPGKPPPISERVEPAAKEVPAAREEELPVLKEEKVIIQVEKPLVEEKRPRRIEEYRGGVICRPRGVTTDVEDAPKRKRSVLETRRRFLPRAPAVVEVHQNKLSGSAACRADAERRRQQRIERCKANGEYYEEMTQSEKTRFFSQQAISNHRRAHPEKFLHASEKHTFLAFKCFLDQGDYASAKKALAGLDAEKYKPWSLLLRTRQAEVHQERTRLPTPLPPAEKEEDDQNNEEDEDGEWLEEYETESEESGDDAQALCSVVLRGNEFVLKKESVLDRGLEGALAEFEDPLIRQALRRTAIQVCRERREFSGKNASSKRDATVVVTATPKGSYAVLLVEECERRPPPKQEDLERAREIVDLVLYKKGRVTLGTVEEVLKKDREFGQFLGSIGKAYTKNKGTELDDVAIAELLREDEIPVTTWEVGRRKRSFWLPPPLGFLPRRDWNGPIENMLLLPEWTLIVQVWSGDFIKVCHGEVRVSCAAFLLLLLLLQKRQQQRDEPVRLESHALKPRKEATSVERKRAEKASLTLQVEVPGEGLENRIESVVLSSEEHDYDNISAVSSPDF